MEQHERILPIGIQSFEKIRQEGLLYVDKMDLVWQLTHSGYQYIYLSRPRRFGKSVLVDTLQCYFEGRKELFEGLNIMSLEKEWVKRPVIRLDMSRGGANAVTLRSYLDDCFTKYEEIYEIKPKSTDQLVVRFNNILGTKEREVRYASDYVFDKSNFKDGRCISLLGRYTFKDKKRYKGESAAGDEMDRL